MAGATLRELDVSEMTIAEILEHIQLAIGMSGTACAEQIGVAQQTYSYYKTGERAVSYRDAPKVRGWFNRNGVKMTDADFDRKVSEELNVRRRLRTLEKGFAEVRRQLDRDTKRLAAHIDRLEQQIARLERRNGQRRP
jgi:transcriptional regulator with XRE-family HTH domain